jgi:hypothetical protein
MKQMPNKSLEATGMNAWGLSLMRSAAASHRLPVPQLLRSAASRMSCPARNVSVTATAVLLLITSGCIIPTVSLHSTKEVEISITEAESGKPVGPLPIHVVYCTDTVTPLYLHVELRQPPELRAETDESGKAVIPLADYAWQIYLDAGTNRFGRPMATFYLPKRLVQQGGFRDEWDPGGLGRPRLRLTLAPVKTPPNKALQATAATPGG